MVGVTPSAAHSLAHPVAQGLVPLAQDLDQKKVTPGLLGFVVFAVMAVGLWALMKSMGKHMKKIDFEEQPADERRPAAAPAGKAAVLPKQSAAGAGKPAAGRDGDAR